MYFYFFISFLRASTCLVYVSLKKNHCPKMDFTTFATRHVAWPLCF